MEAGALPRVGTSGVPTLTPRLLRITSDARLVGMVREGRGGAFEALYDRHHRGILSFCRHMLGDADEAEDAVQHTFMAAYRELSDSDKPIHFRAWLFTVARNRCYSIIRARREQPSDSLDEAATEGLAVEVQRRQDLRDLVTDLRRLPDEQRAALVLAELEALSHEDIAGVLGVPRDKVKALVFQARESLVASRTARDTECSEIREQLALGRGASLRRGNLRRHLRECDGCREFRAQVETQRKQFSALLPVLPAAALKEGLFGGAGLLIGGTAAVGGGAVAATALKTGVAKGVLGAVIASVGTAGTLVVTGSGLEIKTFVHEVERAVPRFVPTSRILALPTQRQPLARPHWVQSTHSPAVRSFTPTEVVKSAAPVHLYRPAAVVTHPRRHFVAARLASPVYVRHMNGRAPVHATPPATARPVVVLPAGSATQPTALPTQVPSAASTTTHTAAPAPAPTAPAPTAPAPTSPPASTPPAAAPAAPAPQPTPAAASTPATPAAQPQAADPSVPAASAHSVTGDGNGNGNGNGNSQGHSHGWSASGGSVSDPSTTTSTTTTTTSTTTTSATTTSATTTSTTTTPMTPAATSNAGSTDTTTTSTSAAGTTGQGGGDGSGSSRSNDQGGNGGNGSNQSGNGAGGGDNAPGAGNPYSH